MKAEGEGQQRRATRECVDDEADMFRELQNLLLTRRLTDTNSSILPETEPDGNRMAHRLQFDNKTPSPNEIPILLHPMKQGQYDVAEEICAISSFQFQTHTPTTRLAKRNQYRIDRYVYFLCYRLPSCSRNADHAVSSLNSLMSFVEQVRKLITQHQFNNEPLRILLASPRAGLNSQIASSRQHCRSIFFTEMKLSYTSMKNPEILKWNGLNRRYAVTATTSGAAGRRRNEDGG
ncbi:hypothetical protein BJ165DRAFT_671052 [Panaeolus papilionaceus]|nr:hypothetical protein BJ165DRAFT_671052 [Panaeolus papilionaceus]